MPSATRTGRARGDLSEFPGSLEMRDPVRAVRRVGRERIAQLINKTNQFNLTTRRYTEAEVAAMEQDPPSSTRCRSAAATGSATTA